MSWRSTDKTRGLLHLLISFTLFVPSTSQRRSAEEISTLLRDRLKNYDKDIVPIRRDSPPTIFVQMFINDMVPYEKINMHYSADFLLHLRWFDYRLQNNSKSEESIPLSGNAMNNLWLPDIFFPSAKKGSIHTVPEINAGARLFLNGTVVYSKRMSVVSFCPMEMLYYPFDIQECKFPLMSYTYSRDFLQLAWNEDGGVQTKRDGDDLYMSDFNHVKYATSKINSTFGKLGNHDRLIITFTFFRYFPFYFLRDFFPCILIVVLSWVSFWIDYTSTPARVSLGITTILTIVTMTNNVRANSPPAGMFRSLDYYLLMCNLFVFAALGEYALVGLTHYRPKQKKKESRANNNETQLTFVAPKSNTSSRTTMTAELYPENKLPPVQTVRPAEPPKAKLRQVQILHRIDNVSKILFPILFCVFNAIYFLFHRFSEHTVD